MEEKQRVSRLANNSFESLASAMQGSVAALNSYLNEREAVLLDESTVELRGRVVDGKLKVAFGVNPTGFAKPWFVDVNGDVMPETMTDPETNEKLTGAERRAIVFGPVTRSRKASD